MTPISISSDNLSQKVLDFIYGENRVGFALLSPEFKVIRTSDNFCEFLLDPRTEPVGQFVTDLFLVFVGSEEGLGELLDGDTEYYRLDKVAQRKPDGSLAYHSFIGLPLNAKSPRDGLIIIIEDASEEGNLEQQLVQDRNELRLTKNNLSRANDELQRLNRLKSLFLSISAHDMRNPLNAIYGYTDLIKMDLQNDISPSVKQYLDIIASQVGTLDRLITDFLELDSIEQGKLTIRLMNCNLNELVDEVVGVIGILAEKKGVLLETHLSSDLPNIMCDTDRIRQILFNLVNNAIKYTSEGDRVEISTLDEPGTVLIIVKDHGPGIPVLEQDKLFDLYHRTASARDSHVSGLGLGLFIVKSFVDAHGGEIFVESTVGEGTTFTVRIPEKPKETNGGNIGRA